MKKIALVVVAASLAAAMPAFAQQMPVNNAPPPQTAMPPATLAPGNMLRASKVIGARVVNEQNQSLGRIDDLVVTQGRADAPKIVLGTGNAGNDNVVAIVSAGGFLGIDRKLVAVRYDALMPAADGHGFILIGVTKDSIKAAPEFKY